MYVIAKEVHKISLKIQTTAESDKRLLFSRSLQTRRISMRAIQILTEV